VREVLEMFGFNSLFEIYTDLHQATDSFLQTALILKSSVR
jgi:hypothetical protein